MKPIIEVHDVYKRYRYGLKQPYYSLRDGINQALKFPFSILKSHNNRGKRKENEFWALRDISFNVMPGEVLGIIGRNGAGKSTLLKILSRITPPTKGNVTMRGRVSSLLEVGTGFNPELTGRENIYLNGAILGMKRSEINNKYDKIVEFSEIEKFLDTPVKYYSSGMYVRLAFAVAAHLEPEILIVDEVLAVGDLNFRKKCLGKMKEVSTNLGRTVLFVSHDMSAIKSLCQRVIFLDKGRIKFLGEAGKTIRTYLEYTAPGLPDKQKLEWVPFKKSYRHSEIVAVKRFSIIDKSGKIVKGKLFNSSTYRAVIEADLKVSNASLIFALNFYDDGHNLLFVSDVCDNGIIEFSHVKPGKITLSVPVPVEIFANRTYEVELVCCLQGTDWIIPPENETRLRFDFYRDVDLNPYFNSAVSGLIAPVLPWNLKHE